MDIGITGQTLKRMALPSATLQEVTLDAKRKSFHNKMWKLHYDAIITIEKTKVIQVPEIRTQGGV